MAKNSETEGNVQDWGKTRENAIEHGDHILRQPEVIDPPHAPERRKMCGLNSGGRCGARIMNNTTKLRIFHLNVQSLPGKIDELLLYLDLIKPDAVCLSEHWCVSDDIMNLNIPNFTLATHYSRSGRLHGGTVIYVHSGLKYKPLNKVLPLCSEMDVEFCAAELTEYNIIIACVYRPSTSHNFNVFLSSFERLAELLHAGDREVCIAGDFSLDLEKDSAMLTNTFKDILDSFNLRACITEPTRGCRCIDNFFTTLPRESTTALVVNPALSDHQGLLLDITLNMSACEVSGCVRYGRRITDGGLRKLSELLIHETWPEYCLDVDVQAEYLIQKYASYLQACFPLRKVNTSVPFCIQWFDSTLKAMRDKIITLNDIYRTTKNPDVDELLRSVRKQYKKEIVVRKRRAYDRFLMRATNLNKAGWKLVNSIRNPNGYNRQHRIPENLTADYFNRHFAEVASTVLETLRNAPAAVGHSVNTTVINNKCFFLSPITEPDVARVIASLSNSSSLDIYGLNSRVVKSTADIIIPFLTSLINNIFHTGNWPEAFKKSKVIPVFKKGEEGEPGNYRPIAIVPIFSKVVEVLLYKQLMQFFNDFKVLNPAQFGFRPGCSTVGAVAEVVRDIVEGLDRGEQTMLILCDLTKAFDCVSHEILCEKLERQGVRGVPLRLLRSYLTGRAQCVELGGKKSEFLPVLHGVPQGSVLAPLLFIVYVNDLPDYMMPSCRSILYADDTSFIVKSNNQDNLRVVADGALADAEHWFASNRLLLNRDKTQSLILTADNRYNVDPPVKLLGVVLDAHLRWDTHVDQLCGKLSSVLFLLRSLRGCLNQDILLATYYALFHSRLSYGVILWGNRNAAERALILQKKALRIIYRLPYREHCKPYFRRSGIMTVPAMYVFCMLSHIHEHRSRYLTHASVHSHNTRNKDHLIGNRHRYYITDKNSVNIALYNKIDTVWKTYELARFKKVLKTYLIENPIYTVEEFHVPAPP